MILERVDLLKAMHKVMCHMNDEFAYEIWVTEGVPDEPSNEDYEQIANDYTMYKHVIETFEDIMKDYIVSGIVG